MPSSLRANHPRRPPSQPRSAFDLDNYLNPLVPRNPLFRFPTWMSYWFGYRLPTKATRPARSRRRLQTLKLWLSVFVGAFCGVAIIENVFLALPPLSGHAVPTIASFGAAAILEYNAIESPLSQPRNMVVGHILSATVAVGITKLFALLPPDRFDNLRWLAGALAVGTANLVMSITKTVHPPAGATALLAATSVDIRVLGWWLVPLVLLGAMLMLASALVLNNIAARRFPLYWWTPVDLNMLREERCKEQREQQGTHCSNVMDVDLEKATESSLSTSFTIPPATAATTPDISNTEAGFQGGGGHLRSKPDTQARCPCPTHTVSYSAASSVPHAHPPTSASEAMVDRQSSRAKPPAVARATTQTTGSRRQMSRSRSRFKHRQRHPRPHEPSNGPRDSADNDSSAVDADADADADARIIITKHQLLVPDWLELHDYEDEVLRILMERFKSGLS
ncbi:hypothetical protein A1O3_09142 [Capronia epimyces CBS 606.96]|uniref:HPP transmembrane region domain-containing protein n=1 Tax=Capronia epimyces CBS 606.96 TaxID=1182542 RepID=W9XCR2_9EURO|nr:uncharacterized protein A1O3_09142 [Capronia epimyces CBS 606.96]EXJ77983.1 hypothetical protein A1O3_09142 [Capronia epimyces CBS 606.96]